MKGCDFTELHKFFCKIAGIKIEILCRYPFTYNLCKQYLIPETPCDISVCADDEDIKHELSLSTVTDIGYCESICIYRKICHAIPKLGAVMFHSSCVAVNDEAYAFFGQSGAGKSTHTRLWKELLGDKMTVINGDKPIYKYENGTLIAYGAPWCGKEGEQSNISAPLKAICLITKAKENSIRELSGDEAAEKIISQVLIPNDAESVVATFDFLDRMLKDIKVYELCCNISKEAAELSYNTMKGI